MTFQVPELALLCVALALPCACSRAPDSYAPPAQFVMPSGPEPAIPVPPEGQLMLYMSDDDAAARVQDDIKDQGDGYGWRTMGPHPRFRVDIGELARFDVYLRFFRNEEDFHARGPITLVAGVNGHHFAPLVLPHTGDQEWRWHVPADWITRPGPVEITLDVSPPGRTYDGSPMGILMHSIGLVKRPQ